MQAFVQAAVFQRGLDDLPALYSWLESAPWDERILRGDFIERVRLTLAEAFANAVIHAHGGESSRMIRVRLEFTSDSGLLVAVTDSGPGFDPDKIGAPSVDSETGRGISILRRLASEIQYHNNTLSFRIPGGS